MLCSNIETGIGCVASSIPSLRHFLQGPNDGSSGPSGKRSGAGTKLVTVGGGGSRQPRRLRDSFRNPTDLGFSLSSVAHGRGDDWERLDGDSDKSDAPVIDPKRIYAERSYAVDIESHPRKN